MSLKVWLPLIKNTKNYGTDKIIFDVYRAAQDSSGKIGSCYSFSNYANLKYTNFNIDLSKWTISAWIYMSAIPTGTSYIISLSGGNGSVANHALILAIEADTGTIRATTNSNYAVNEINTNGWALNTWTHAAATFDGTTVKLYINGKFVNEASNTPTATLKTNLVIGARSNASDGSTTSYSFTGKLNDVRIYDECLGAARIEEIAQGLILHYKLDKLINNNLYVGSLHFTGTWNNNINNRWTISNQKYRNFTVLERSSAWNGLSQTVTCTQGDIFTLSFYAKIDSGGLILSITSGATILDGNFSNGSTAYWVRSTEDGTEWKRYWATAQITSNITSFTWAPENTVDGKIFRVCGMKLEKGSLLTPWCISSSESTLDRITDSSGYGNHGEIVGELELSNDTPRYSTDIQFPGTAYIKITSPSTEVRTISLWVKWNSIPSGQSIIYVDLKSKTGLGLASNGIIVNTNQTGNTFNKSSLVANTWYHFVIVSPNGSSNASRKLYINGVELTALSSTNSWSYTIDELLLGKRSTSSDGFNGKISDFRMYCTALDADAVRLLYEVSAKVDNKQNIHTFELVENDNTILITKKGHLKCSELEEEDGTTKFFKTDKTIHTQQIVEN